MYKAFVMVDKKKFCFINVNTKGSITLPKLVWFNGH